MNVHAFKLSFHYVSLPLFCHIYEKYPSIIFIRVEDVWETSSVKNPSKRPLSVETNYDEYIQLPTENIYPPSFLPSETNTYMEAGSVFDAEHV